MAKKEKMKNSEAENLNLNGEIFATPKEPENSPQGENKGNSEQSKDNSVLLASKGTGKKDEQKKPKGTARFNKLNNLNKK